MPKSKNKCTAKKIAKCAAKKGGSPKICNPKTGRCVLKDGKVGKKILAEKLIEAKKPAKPAKSEKPKKKPKKPAAKKLAGCSKLRKDDCTAEFNDAKAQRRVPRCHWVVGKGCKSGPPPGGVDWEILPEEEDVVIGKVDVVPERRGGDAAMSKKERIKLNKQIEKSLAKYEKIGDELPEITNIFGDFELKMGQVRQIYANPGEAIWVVEPQDYDKVTKLDNTNEMFTSAMGSHDSTNCGLFYCHRPNDNDDSATSGSGMDPWFVASPEFLEALNGVRNRHEARKKAEKKKKPEKKAKKRLERYRRAIRENSGVSTGDFTYKRMLISNFATHKSSQKKKGTVRIELWGPLRNQLTIMLKGLKVKGTNGCIFDAGVGDGLGNNKGRPHPGAYKAPEDIDYSSGGAYLEVSLNDKDRILVGRYSRNIECKQQRRSGGGLTDVDVGSEVDFVFSIEFTVAEWKRLKKFLNDEDQEGDGQEDIENIVDLDTLALHCLQGRIFEDCPGILKKLGKKVK